jgi:anti-sigma factor RsiW
MKPMFKEPDHLSDEDILLVLDGESSRKIARSAQAHLAACWECRSRMGELEGTIEAFVSLHRRTLGRELPDPKVPTALLRARLAEAAAGKSGWHFFRLPIFARAFACLCAAVLVAGGLLFFEHPQSHPG